MCVRVLVRSSPPRDKQLAGHRLLAITWVVLSTLGCKKFLSNKWHACMCNDCEIDKLYAHEKFRQSWVVTQCHIIDRSCNILLGISVYCWLLWLFWLIFWRESIFRIFSSGNFEIPIYIMVIRGLMSTQMSSQDFVALLRQPLAHLHIVFVN